MISYEFHPVGYIQFYSITNYLPEGITDCNHPLFDDFKANELVGIDLFIADENYLGTGFSSNALGLFIHLYIKGKFKGILVDPLTQNRIANLFFERNGFRRILSQNSNHYLLLLKID